MSAVVTAEELIGLWSADVMYGPGAQSDEVLVFKPDGTGFMEFINPMTTSADLFQWAVEAPGHLRLRGYKSLHLSEGQPLRVEEYPSQLDGVFTIQVQVEDTKVGRPMRVLRFWERPWSGISDHYGFCRRDTTGAEEPDFSWIERWPTEPVVAVDRPRD
jgi:hypothetical protein